MPNWCSTAYACVGDRKTVRSLYKTIEKLDKRKTSLVPNGFGNLWLGNLITALGGDWEKIYCRGDITSYQIVDDVLFIYQETAWTECEQVRYFLKEKFPELTIYFIEEECGCGVYATNDHSGIYFPTRYILDTNEGIEDFETLEGVAEWISDIVGQQVEASEEAIETAVNEYMEIHEEDDDCYMYFHAFDVVDE